MWKLKGECATENFVEAQEGRWPIGSRPEISVEAFKECALDRREAE